MSLTVNQMNQILKEMVVGDPISIKTPEAEEFSQLVKEDVELARRKGWIIEIPQEFAVDIGEGEDSGQEDETDTPDNEEKIKGVEDETMISSDKKGVKLPVDESGRRLFISHEIPQECWKAYGNKDVEQNVEAGVLEVGDKTTSGTVEKIFIEKDGDRVLVMVDTGNGKRDIMQYKAGSFADAVDQIPEEEAPGVWVQKVKEIAGSEEPKEKSYGDQLEIIKVDAKKHLVYGVFLWPDKADHDGDVISADDIEKVAHGFLIDYRDIDEMHQKEKMQASIVESFIAWKDGLEYHGKVLKKGVWAGGIYVADKVVWDKIEKGEYKGFSVRISGRREPVEGANA